MAGIKRTKQEEETLERVGLVVKALRSARDMTQDGLAAAIGHSQNQVWMVEKGKVDPGVLILKKIAEALHVPLATLLLPVHGSQAEIDAALTAAIMNPPKKAKT